MNKFLLRYMPLFQMPDAPSSPAPASGGSEPSSAPSISPSASPGPAPSTTSTPSPDAGSPTPTPSDGADPSIDKSFEFMFSPEGTDPFGEPSPTVEPKPEPAPTQPSAPPVQPAAAKPEPAPASPSATPAPTEPTSPTPAEPPSAPSLDPFDPGHLAQHLAQNEEKMVQHVADNLFKLSPKDVEELESNVVETIPKLLARSFVAAQKNFLMQMSQIIPTMIQRQGEVTKAHTEAENAFYSRWPDIKKDQHGELVLRYARVYGQMHPQSTRQERIEAVGPMVMMAAKIVPGAPAAVAKPSSPMVPTGASGRPPQPSPFVPAGPSAGGAAPSTAPQLTPVEAMFVGDPNEA